jgi:hypothetical protein
LIDDLVDLRAFANDLEFKISFEPATGRVSGTLLFDNPAGALHLRRDPGSVHDLAAVDAPPADDRYRVFVGRGIFVEGDPSYANESLVTFNALPWGPRDELLAAMEQWGIATFDVGPTEIVVALAPHLGDMDNPLSHCHSAIQLMASEAPLLIASPPSGGGDKPAFVLGVCARCGSRFLRDGSTGCVNCGSTQGR